MVKQVNYRLPKNTTLIFLCQEIFYEMFHQNVVDNSLVRVKSFLTVSPTGQITDKYEDNYDPRYYDTGKKY